MQCSKNATAKREIHKKVPLLKKKTLSCSIIYASINAVTNDVLVYCIATSIQWRNGTTNKLIFCFHCILTVQYHCLYLNSKCVIGGNSCHILFICALCCPAPSMITATLTVEITKAELMSLFPHRRAAPSAPMFKVDYRLSSSFILL